jgi:hypothetical protein
MAAAEVVLAQQCVYTTPQNLDHQQPLLLALAVVLVLLEDQVVSLLLAQLV